MNNVTRKESPCKIPRLMLIGPIVICSSVVCTYRVVFQVLIIASIKDASVYTVVVQNCK